MRLTLPRILGLLTVLIFDASIAASVTPDPTYSGNRTFVPGISIHAAIIMSDYKAQADVAPQFNATLADAPGSLISERGQHARRYINSLPFSVVEWPPVFTKQCPAANNNQHLQQRKKHHGDSERGLALAHYYIWHDFVHFDPEVLEEASKNSSANSSSSSSSGSHCSVSPNGTLYKDAAPFLADDILVIFEDDVDVAVQDVAASLRQELSEMQVDLLFLGWCDGRLARPVPLCAHAYAATRRGAEKLIKHFEPCGRALDEQFVIMGKNKWISYRTAHKSSYDKLNERYEGRPDKTRGIFRQSKSLGSLNGH